MAKSAPARRPRRPAPELHFGDLWPYDPAPETADPRLQALAQSLPLLPAEQREVVVLKVWGALTFEQIGEQLQLSPNTAASRWRYAMEALRRLINARTHA